MEISKSKLKYSIWNLFRNIWSEQENKQIAKITKILFVHKQPLMILNSNFLRYFPPLYGSSLCI